MKMIIDRFEGDYAIVELPGRVMMDLSKKLLPQGAKEGDVLEIRILPRETEARKKEVSKQMGKLWR